MAIKYVPYPVRTLEGQAVLDNFVRTRRVLRYQNANNVYKRIVRGMPLYEDELLETNGDSENLILRGECVSACAYLKDKNIKVDLVYIDPPFASGANYAKKIYVRRNPKVAEIIHEAVKEVEVETLQSFEEVMYGDIWDKELYLNWMYENLCAIKSIMSDTACIYVHLDYHIGHYVKILLDEIFGEQNLVNEIIWKKTNAHNFKQKGFVKANDLIYLYAMNIEQFTFNEQYTKISEAQLSRYKKDENGRYYTGQDLTFTGNSANRKFTWRGATPPPGRVWGMDYDQLEDLYKKGLILLRKDGVPRLDGYKVYLDDKKGTPLTNIWDDIDRVGNTSSERLDYETQKPEELLERIIKASSDEGMLVADFFGGSGTTARTAFKLGRKFIHTDININSIQLTRDELKKANAKFQLIEINGGLHLFRNPTQTNEKLRTLIKGLSLNSNLDKKYWAGSIMTTKDGAVPVHLPDLKNSSLRLLDIPYINTIIRDALPDLPADTKRVKIYYIDIDNYNEIKTFIKEQNTDSLIEIELCDLKDILDEVVISDEATFHVSKVKEGLLDVWQITIDSFLSDYVLTRIAEFNQKSAAQAQSKGIAYTPLTISDEGLETIEWLSLDCEHGEPDAPWHSDVEIYIDKNGYAALNGKATGKFWDGTISTIDDRCPLRLKIRNICGDESIFEIK